MIKAIFIADKIGQQQQRVQSIQLVADKGIVGDRNFDQHRWPGQNITFIDQHSIDQFNHHYQQSIAQNATRRNVITTGIDLNALVGQTFRIGTVEFIGKERCEPCKDLANRLSNENVSTQQVFEHFTANAGIRATVCNDGEISEGMAFSL